MASAYVIFNILKYEEKEILFESKSGVLSVKKNNDWLEMDFPSQAPIQCPIPDQILNAFDQKPIECLKSEDYIVVFENEESILNAKPNLLHLSELDLRGVVITAKSKEYDFVTRFFAPNYGINEDPVTGSAFTSTAKYVKPKSIKNTTVVVFFTAFLLAS